MAMRNYNLLSKKKQTRFFKIILVGNPMVGKTSLRLQYMGIGFQTTYMPTLGADISIKNYQNYRLQIWDLAGQVNFRNIIMNYFNNGHGIVFVFDVTRPETLQTVSDWFDQFIEVNQKMVPAIIVGNKIDLRDPQIEAEYRAQVLEYITNVSNKYNMEFQYIETSALTGENISSAFVELVNEIINHRK